MTRRLGGAGDPSLLRSVVPSGRRLSRGRALALLALGFLGVLAGLATAVLAAGPDPGTLRFEWSIGDRYGLDANGDEIVDNHDGLTDLAGDRAFIQSPTYALTFDTCTSLAVTERDELIKTYKVTLNGPESVTASGSNCKVTANVTKLGSYTAKVELISELGTVYDTRIETIEPKDHLIVSVGDSMASGEGNPDRVEGDFPFYSRKWQNAQCHRSGLAGPAQAALRMERRDPHSSITFVHLACSGASIEEGLIGSYNGAEPALGTPLRPQLDVLEDLAGARQVDALVVSIGANDAKFASVVEKCMFMTNCHTDHVFDEPNAKDLFDAQIGAVDRAYPLLDARLDRMAASQAGKPPVLKGKAFFTEYHDVTKDDDGEYCTGLTQKERDAGTLPSGQTTDGISQAEMEWASANVQDEINRRVKAQIAAANATGGSHWEWLDGINAQFSTHGYCARDRWVRNLFESFLYQGGIHGAFHPNAEGHFHVYAQRIEGSVAPFLGVAGDALPPRPDASTTAIGDALRSWIGQMDDTGGMDAITSRLPFSAEVQAFIRDAFFGQLVPVLDGFKSFLASITSPPPLPFRTAAASASDPAPGMAGPTFLGEVLDDPDRDGNPDIDSFGTGLDFDMTGDVQPKLPSMQYDITVTFKGSVGVTPDLALRAADLGLGGQTTEGLVRFEQTVKLRIDLTKPPGDMLRLTLPGQGLSGKIDVALGAEFGGTDGAANGVDRPPLSFSAGILGLSATGPANANLEMAYRIQDPNGDGRIDADELSRPLDWVRFSCVGGAANLDLAVRAALSGIPVELGSIRLQDPDLCDGVDPPTVDVSNLGEFQGLTPADLINGLAQLTQSLRSIQQTADVDLPFVKEALSGIISVNDKLVRFFVDAGLTDPANPLASITFDPAQRPDLDTIGELAPLVAQALGVAPEGLNLRYDAGRLLFDVGITQTPAPLVGAGTLDVGDQLSRVGLVGVTGSAKATIEPSFALNVGFGIDLRPGLSFAQRFFVKVGDGPELSADAKVTADAQLTGTLALLDVTLADTNVAGPVTLLDRKDPTKPLLAVELDGKGDDQLTLAELTAPSSGTAAPVKLTLNGKVPAFGLSATASLAGAPLAGGTVSVSWADITKTTGAEALAVTVDDTFTRTLLPFSFDPSNPRAAIGQVLTAAQRGVAGLRGVLDKDPELLAGLPMVGRSAADLDPVLARLDAQLARLVELNQSLTLELAEAELEKAIGQALGVPNDRWAGLVTLRFEPQTATANAALVADLTLGLCTDDRTSSGCSHTAGKVDLPFNLQLGQAADSPGLVGLGTGGSATVSFDAGLRLGVGVELPKVTAATTAGGTPTVTGAPQLFVLDTSRFELGLGARVAATLDATLGPVQVSIGTAGQPATAALAARYRLASPTANPAAPVRKRAGSELTAWLATLDPDPTTNGGLHDTVHPAPGCDGADACATLPVFLGTTFLGNITFTAPDLLAPDAWTVDPTAVLNSLSSEAFQFSVLLEGIRSFSLRLENSLRNLPQGTRIPLLGTDPTAGAEVLADFRTSVVEPFQELVATLQTKANAKAVRDEIQGFLYPRIGPDSAVKLLKDTNGNGSVTKDDIVVDLACKIGDVVKACVDADSVLKLEDLQLKAKLGKETGGATTPFDSGFPGLRITSDSGIAATIGFELDLTIGMDRRNGFYVRTNAFGTTPELRVVATASLPNEINGEIAFLPVSVRDLRPDAPDVKAGFGLDLSLGGADGKMGLGQIGQATLAPRFDACANVQLGLVTGGQGGAGSGRLPSLLADLKLSGGLNCTGDAATGAAAATSFSVAFDNVRVDVGTLMNEFIGPAVRNIRKYTGPLEPTIDALREPIPGIAEAARAVGQPEPTWWDLLTTINDASMAAGNPDQLQMVKTVIFVIDLVRSLDGGTGGAGFIPLGDFDLNVARASEPISADRVGELLTNISETPGGSLLARLPGVGVKPEVATKLQDPRSGITFPVAERPSRLFELLLGKDVPLVRFEAAGNFLHVPIGPFAFPVGPATVYFGGSLDLSGHFAAGFDTAGIREAFGLLTDDDPTNDGIGNVGASLLGGFYLDDYDATGKDIPELKVEAEVVVGAGVGAPGFGIFAEGGVGAQASIDLKTDDGKLRPEQLIAQLKKNPNPVCVFNAQAHIAAFVRVVVSTPIGNLEFPVADVTVLDEPDLTAFCNTQQPEPPPGQPQVKVNGRLYSDGLLEVFASPEPDRIYVTQRSPGVVDVSRQGVVERFEGVQKVFVDGAGGADTITVSADSAAGVVPSPLAAVLCGGAGKDRLTSSAGPGALHGDDGPGVETSVGGVPTPLPCTSGPGAADTLTGGSDDDLLDGGTGGDTLLGSGGDDELAAGADDDVLNPGTGDDEVDGGDGRDTLTSADRSEGITTDLRTRRSGGTGTSEVDTLVSIETAVGSSRADHLLASDVATVLDGGAGNDVVTGGGGADVLLGGSGGDVLLGGDGLDTLVGLDGDDRIVGHAGPDLHQGGSGTDTSDWSAEPGPVLITLNGQPDDGAVEGVAAAGLLDNVDTEIVWGTAAADDLRAGATPATLEGRDGNDVIAGPGRLLGENGDDRLQGGPGMHNDVLDGGPGKDDLEARDGSDDLLGGDGDDHLDGGHRNDRLSGGSGFDTLDYSMRPRGITLSLWTGRAREGASFEPRTTSPDCGWGNPAIGQSAGVIECDDVSDDNERILGGQGNDEIWGNGLSQTFATGTGNDVVTGGGGDDVFDGGAGNDDLRDEDLNLGMGHDVFIGGDGDDYLQGYGGATVDGGTGNDDVVSGGDFPDTVDAGPGNDAVSTFDGNDTVELGDGSNTYNGGNGVKHVTGGKDHDSVSRPGSVDGPTFAQLHEGNDSFSGSIARDTVDGGPGNDDLRGHDGDDLLTDLDGANGILGGPGNDVIRTGPATDHVRGEGGNDDIVDLGTGTLFQELWGGGGNDVIRWLGAGPAGEARGETGDDHLVGGPAANLLMGGPGNDVIEGGDGDDRLQGDSEDDTLLGGAGDDAMAGGSGTNLMDGGTGADTFDSEGAGVDTVTYEGRTEPLYVTQGSLTADDGGASDQSATVPGRRDSVGFAVERIIGGAGDDVITLASLGTTAEVGVVEGRNGHDLLLASALTSPDHDTTLLGGDGDDTLVGSTGIDGLKGGAGHDLLRGGPGADVVQGEAGDDRLDEGTAPSGADKLSGGDGIDAVDYSGRTATVTVTIGNGVADDGETSEADEILDAESVRTGAASAPPKPTVTLTAAKSTSVSGELVAWTAVVNQPAGQPAASGSIVLSDGNVSRSFPLDETGRAVMPFALRVVGNRTVTATYNGNVRYAAAASAGVAHTVAKVGTTTTLSVVQTPVATGTQVEVVASVAPVLGIASPDGGVEVREGGVKVGTTINLTNGRGSMKVTLPAGSHELVGVYAGDTISLTSTSSPVSVLVVDGGVAPPPSVGVTAVPGAPVAGDPLSLRATVATGAGVPLPVGALVTFTVPAATAGDPAVVLGTASVQADGTATVTLPSGLAGGTYPVTASVAGTSWMAPGQGSAEITVTRTPTTTTLTSAANPAPVGSGLMLTATVSRAAGSGTPAGTVTFLDGDRVMGTATLSDGTATKLVSLTTGTHTVTARYEGTALLAPSTSDPLTQVVGEPTPPPAATTTALAREGHLLAATVTGPEPAVTGEVRFVVDGTPAATVAVGTGGRATLPVSSLSPAIHSVVAEYLGSSAHGPSTSAALSVDARAATATALAREGDLLAATVTGPAPAIGGQVVFEVDGAPAATVTVGAGGRATMAVTGLTPGTRSVVARYGGSATHLPSASSALTVEVAAPGSRFTALTPARILDTRFGNGAPAVPVPPKGVVELQVTGRGGVPANASAVVLNVTSVALSGAPWSFMTAWPTGEARPNASNLNYVAGEVIPNLVTVKVGTGGKVSLYNDTGSVHVIADVAGYYATGAESAFNALQPERLLDTRFGVGAPAAQVGPNGVVELQVTGRGGVPAGATGVVLNVTAVGLSGTPSSFITAWPSGSPLPNASNLNLVTGQIIPNLVVAKIGTGGKVSLRNDTGSVHLLADVAGYYGATGSTFTPVSPERLLDTRVGTGAPAVRIPAGGTVELQVTGRGGVAAGATAAVLNVTAVSLAGSPTSWITAWPTGQPMPQTSNLNMVTGQIIPNAVVAKIGANGKVSISNAAGNVDVIADVAGYFSG